MSWRLGSPPKGTLSSRCAQLSLSHEPWRPAAISTRVDNQWAAAKLTKRRTRQEERHERLVRCGHGRPRASARGTRDRSDSFAERGFVRGPGCKKGQGSRPLI